MSELIDIHALADGELSPAETARLKAVLAVDAKAKAEHDSILNFKDFIVTQATVHHSEDCWKVCVKRIEAIDRSKKVEFFVGRYSWALCAIFVVAIFGARFVVKDVMGDSVRAADIGRIFPFSSHAQPSQSPADQRMVAEILREAKQAIDPQHVRVIGATKGLMGNVPVIRLDMRDGEGVLALYVLNDSVNFEDTAQVPAEPGVASGVIPANVPSGHVNCLVWNDHGKTILLAGDRDTQALESVMTEMGFRLQN